MFDLIKRPEPQNFKTGNVSLSKGEYECLKAGDFTNLIILKWNSNDVYLSKPITKEMIESVQSKDTYYLMRYR
jgi:hypothetical protein